MSARELFHFQMQDSHLYFFNPMLCVRQILPGSAHSRDVRAEFKPSTVFKDRFFLPTRQQPQI